jgi:N-acetylmuramoyl-L-alanine amidase
MIKNMSVTDHIRRSAHFKILLPGKLMAELQIYRLESDSFQHSFFKRYMRFYRLIILLVASSLFCIPAFAAGKKVTKVVLDAGHGGKDGGARGEYSSEKDLTLAIVLKIGKLLKDSLRDVQPFYTRVSDVYPSLKERHEIANQAAADLFISVHINSTPFWYEKVQTGSRTVTTGRGKKRKTRTVPVYKSIKHHTTQLSGTESLVLGSIRNNEKSKAVGEYGDAIVDEPGLLNEADPQTAIILAQYTKAFLGSSVALGTAIQEQFMTQGRRDHGVKQQSLQVLAGSYMPGVLVECGFITNPTEEAYMNSEAGQWEIARAIFKGIKAYKADIDSKAGN